MTGRLVEVTDVEFSYGTRPVLFGASLHVEHGEALGLLGTNGAGKSTLLRLIAGLNHPTRGSITFDGADISSEPAEALVGRGLALISGGQAVFRDMTVRENLEIFAGAFKGSQADLAARHDEVLATFPAIGGRLSSLAGSLSGGEQQQLALAKALLLRPRLLCIDELSLGLAPTTVEAILRVVDGLHASGMTLIVVEQSLNIAAKICQRAVFMEKGEVRFEGPTTELIDNDEIARAVFLGDRARA